ncbi:hypothetical protein C9374_002867 [Naegleria lovaniensis]|uniref:Uncharacterized protein n=1 Tax=Naegleria lovaniensis TaxID=51637 RepID=A0AA88GV59_NAELO|nr:uncharacterized protein C9374_002867 [Naegleria lovaniensis]KAG2386421.1 hypothetical protein C9374_002867 [Naegleria lovaniensis]
MFSSSLVPHDEQVSGDVYDKGKKVNETSSSTSASQKDREQQFLKNNPTVQSVSTSDKSPSGIRKEKEQESSFFDNPNPIPNLNTTEKMANKTPIGSYVPGSYVAGSTEDSDMSDIPSPHMGKPIDRDPTQFFGFDNNIYGDDLYTAKDATAKALGTDKSFDTGSSEEWKGSPINKDQWSDTKEKVKDQFSDTKEQLKSQWSDTKEKVKDQFSDAKEQVKKNVSSSENWTSGYDDVAGSSSTADTLYNTAKNVKDQVKDVASDVKETIKDKASNLFSQDTKDAAYEAKENLKDTASNLFESGKDKFYETKGYTEAYLEEGEEKAKDTAESVKDTVKHIKDKVVNKVSEWKENIVGGNQPSKQ